MRYLLVIMKLVVSESYIKIFIFIVYSKLSDLSDFERIWKCGMLKFIKELRMGYDLIELSNTERIHNKLDKIMCNKILC